MAQLLLLENPRRKKKRKSKRTMPTGLKRYWAKLRAKKKNPRTALGKRVVKHRPVFYGSRKKLGIRSHLKRLNKPKGIILMARKRHHRRRHYRRNPPFLRGLTGGIGGKVMSMVTGAAGIAVNKLITNQVAPLVKADANSKKLIEIGSALLLLPMIAKFAKFRGAEAAANVAGAVAVFEAAKDFLPTSFKPMIAAPGDYQPDNALVVADLPYYDASTPMPLY